MIILEKYKQTTTFKKKKGDYFRKVTISQASIILMWCHPSARKMWQFKLSQNHKINTMFLAKIYTAASLLRYFQISENVTQLPPFTCSNKMLCIGYTR